MKRRPRASTCQTSINALWCLHRRRYIALANAARFLPQISPYSTRPLAWVFCLDWRGETGGRRGHSWLAPDDMYSRDSAPNSAPATVWVCARRMWQGRSSSVSDMTPPGPSWAAANLCRETGTWAGICRDIYEAISGASQHKWSVNLAEDLYIRCYQSQKGEVFWVIIGPMGLVTGGSGVAL